MDEVLFLRGTSDSPSHLKRMNRLTIVKYLVYKHSFCNECAVVEFFFLVEFLLNQFFFFSNHFFLINCLKKEFFCFGGVVKKKQRLGFFRGSKNN